MARLTATELELVARLERRAEFLRERAENLRALVALHDGTTASFPRDVRDRYEDEATRLDIEAGEMLDEARTLRASKGSEGSNE